MESSPLLLPLRLLKPTKLAPNTNLSGFFLPDRPSRSSMILADWDGASWALHLAGEHAFRFFEIKTDIAVEGVLFEEYEVIVDMASRFSARLRDPVRGDLTAKDGKAFLAGVPVGGFFDDVADFPLSTGCAVGTAGVAMQFSRWSLVASDGEKRVNIWAHDGVAPAS